MTQKSFTVRLPLSDWKRIAGKVTKLAKSAKLNLRLSDNRIANELFIEAERAIDEHFKKGIQ